MLVWGYDLKLYTCYINGVVFALPLSFSSSEHSPSQCGGSIVQLSTTHRLYKIGNYPIQCNQSETVEHLLLKFMGKKHDQ